jgi:hypothetical protein
MAIKKSICRRRIGNIALDREAKRSPPKGGHDTETDCRFV